MASFGPFGTLVVALNDDRALRNAFRQCANDVFKGLGLSQAQQSALLLRDPDAIKAEFIAENGGDDNTPGHVRGTVIVGKLNKVNDGL